MNKKDNRMLEEWLSSIKEDNFQMGIKFACEKILNECKAESMPNLMAYGDDKFYVSVDEIERIIVKIEGVSDD